MTETSSKEQQQTTVGVTFDVFSGPKFGGQKLAFFWAPKRPRAGPFSWTGGSRGAGKRTRIWSLFWVPGGHTEAPFLTRQACPILRLRRARQASSFREAVPRDASRSEGHLQASLVWFRRGGGRLVCEDLVPAGLGSLLSASFFNLKTAVKPVK